MNGDGSYLPIFESLLERIAGALERTEEHLAVLALESSDRQQANRAALEQFSAATDQLKRDLRTVLE